MKIKTIIVDDEPLARQRIKNLLVDIQDIELLCECPTGKKAIEMINKLNPDLVYLDIRLKDMTGFNVLEKLDVKIKPVVIFITAYDEYALKAFEIFAFDYLQKPFKDERFYKSTAKAIESFNQKSTLQIEGKLENLLKYINRGVEMPLKTPKRLPIKLGSKVVFINHQEIKYIVASGYYAEVHTEPKKYLLRESLSKLISDLDPDKFIRIHRSTIINIDYIKELINSNYGEIDVKMLDNNLFRISKSYRKDFSNMMGIG